MYSRTPLSTPFSTQRNAGIFTRSFTRVAPNGTEHLEGGALAQGLRENSIEYILVMAAWGQVYHVERKDEQLPVKLVKWDYPHHVDGSRVAPSGLPNHLCKTQKPNPNCICVANPFATIEESKAIHGQIVINRV
ncbi:hypothetical protein M422DRAFT_249640 [Sphaerobolus stellatus SS14]|uniref:Uncharacterized protein n=1 Tax=Sphaerobolus stellatus (strain SS14) TaxID=990650 RepID=A0A0C9VV24_SPHS4|nr:hypothetical protein M422DRAFT_249640 [Sphaerobolus stellatus SS14]